MLPRAEKKRFNLARFGERLREMAENKWVGRTVAALAISLMLISVVYLFLARFSPDGIPTVMGNRFMIVLSGSMSPAFDAGDIVVVRELDPKAVQTGQVITFRDPVSPKNFITHRVIEVVHKDNTVLYRTKGDANDAIDKELVPWRNVVGHVVMHVPYGGYLVNFIRTLPGLLLFIVIPGILIIIGEFRTIARLLREVDDKPRLEGR